mmetsp:Transcript_13665/g.41311  ORF Transcript_13665/g.41311 Transcript_13665/m.41311 type:complete len:232 (-) Transcript_13665:1257-1952(-)
MDYYDNIMHESSNTTTKEEETKTRTQPRLCLLGLFEAGEEEVVFLALVVEVLDGGVVAAVFFDEGLVFGGLGGGAGGGLGEEVLLGGEVLFEAGVDVVELLEEFLFGLLGAHGLGEVVDDGVEDGDFLGVDLAYFLEGVVEFVVLARLVQFRGHLRVQFVEAALVLDQFGARRDVVDEAGLGRDGARGRGDLAAQPGVLGDDFCMDRFDFLDLVGLFAGRVRLWQRGELLL